MSKYLTRKSKETTMIVAFQVAPPMAYPRKENTNTSNNKMEVVLSSIVAPTHPNTWLCMKSQSKHDSANTHRNIIVASVIMSFTMIPHFFRENLVMRQWDLELS